MADVLDQDEVDALLNAVAGGDLEMQESDSQSDLMSAMGSAAVGSSTATLEVRSYDFKRPERVSKDQMMALEGLHEGFARNFGALLSGYLRTIIEVKVRSTEQLTYAEFTYSLPTPTVFYLLSANPLDGQVLFEISPLIVFPIIDRMLGGNSSELYIPQRPLTQIEQRLADRLLERALDSLSEAWSNITEVTFDLIQSESNPQLVQVVAPNEVVVVIGCEVKMGDRSGSMSICIPFNVIEPLMSRLTSQDWFNYRKKSEGEGFRGSIRENIADAKLKCRTFIGQAKIKVSELMSLEPGDVLKIEKESVEDLVFQIEGISKFAGKAGQFRGKKALKVTRKAKPGERI